MTAQSVYDTCATNLDRWKSNAVSAPPWHERVKIIASMIPPGSRVLDVGAGSMTLRTHLAKGCHYTPVDLDKFHPETVVADFNSLNIPTLKGRYDYVVCSGIMEYINPVHHFVATVSRWSDRVILSYAVAASESEISHRKSIGWFNHLSHENLLDLFQHHGLSVLETVKWERQQIFVLDTSAASASLYSSHGNLEYNNIISIYRHDPGNVGDFYCPPFRYFRLGSIKHLDILKPVRPSDVPHNVVVGGGGLVGNSTFDPHLSHLLSFKHKSFIGWGFGSNCNIDVRAGYVEKADLSYPDFIKRFNLLGVRDYGSNYSWVPCASCMHPVFSETWPLINDVVVFEHKRVPINISDFPKMNNDTCDLLKAVRFIGSSRVVITNSYHGAYWAQLLGKGVLIFPFSEKFYHLKHKATYCKPHEWKKHLLRVEQQEPALKECRTTNINYWNRVKEVIGEPLPGAYHDLTQQINNI